MKLSRKQFFQTCIAAVTSALGLKFAPPRTTTMVMEPARMKFGGHTIITNELVRINNIDSIDKDIWRDLILQWGTPAKIDPNNR